MFLKEIFWQSLERSNPDLCARWRKGCDALGAHSDAIRQLDQTLDTFGHRDKAAAASELYEAGFPFSWVAHLYSDI